MADNYKKPVQISGVTKNPLDILQECDKAISDKRPWYSAAKSLVFGDKFDKYEADVKQLRYFVEAGGQDDALSKSRQSNPKVAAICEKLLQAINKETSIDVSSMLRDISGAPAKVKQAAVDNVVVPLIDLADEAVEKGKDALKEGFGTIAIVAGVAVAALLAAKSYK